MENKKTLTVIFLIVITAAVVLAIVFSRQPTTPKAAVKEEVQISETEIEKQYRSEIIKIMTAYSKSLAEIGIVNTNNIKDDQRTRWLDLVKWTKNNLLGLKLTAKDKDRHLELVLGLSFLEQGLGGDKEKLEAGKKIIDQVVSKDLWLIESGET